MKKTIGLALTAVILAASLALVPVAYAQDESTDASANAKARGVGKLEAQGDGIAMLHGRGSVDLSGNGTLWVKDNAGDAKIDVTGYGVKKEFPDGWIQYSGMHGTASVKGTGIRVIMSGVDISLTAKGRGGVILWGHGTYDVNGLSGQWDANNMSKSLRLAPTE